MNVETRVYSRPQGEGYFLAYQGFLKPKVTIGPFWMNCGGFLETLNPGLSLLVGKRFKEESSGFTEMSMGLESDLRQGEVHLVLQMDWGLYYDD